MHAAFLKQADTAVSVHLFTSDTWSTEGLAAPLCAFAESQGFTGAKGQTVIMPGADGVPETVLYGLGNGADTLALAGLAAKLPPADYRIDGRPLEWTDAQIAAGWTDGAYRFETYLEKTSEPPRLVLPDPETFNALSREAEAVRRLRDLVNTPAEDMGPSGLQSAVSELAESYGARLEVVLGDALLDHNYPMVHAVGRAAADAPRFIELSWGREDHPEIAIVGKGVAFDTGGLNIKTGDFMRLMKKDMGGAAHAIALAFMVMDADLPVHLKLYVPAVENAVSGNSFRPGDILKTRKGLTVEIDNTDAEGRLILCDALTRAQESDPELMIDFATLTGAARVALGPDLAPFYTPDDGLADEMRTASSSVGDPVWQLPLWAPYRDMLSSSVADICNSGGRMAGSITAAIYLQQFVQITSWIHFDVWAWREARYGRPAGGAATGLRASWELLQRRYGAS